jgi:aminomethyltransferase
VTPLQAGLGWTVSLRDPERDFIGRGALRAQQAAGGLPRCAGVLLEGRGVLRSGQVVFEDGRAVGTITSGGFGPTLERSIGLARLSGEGGAGLEVEIRGRRVPLRVVELPFVRHGRIRIPLQDA